MQERAIHISSVDRQKIGKSKVEDFIIKFTPVSQIQNNMTHKLAMDKVSMTYSWHNISDQYKYNKIKYSTNGGTSWETITFVDGMYSYSDLNAYIHQYMDQQNHKTGNKYDINISFVLSTYRVITQIDNSYQLDLRNTEFGDLIGFPEKIVNKTEYRSRLPNITNSIDMIHINTDAITNTNTLAVIPTDNMTRSFPFTFEPRRLLFNEVLQLNISQMRFYITDSLGRPINLNGVDWFTTLKLRSTPV